MVRKSKPSLSIGCSGCNGYGAGAVVGGEVGAVEGSGVVTIEGASSAHGTGYSFTTYGYRYEEEVDNDMPLLCESWCSLKPRCT